MTSNDDNRWWASTTITDEGRKTRLNLQSLVVTLIVVAVVGWALAEFGRNTTGTGPSGSSFVTDVNGTAALSELLAELGHTVIPAIAPLVGLDPGGTLMILDPGIRSEFLPDEIDAIDEWTSTGGRLIVAGRPHPDLVGTLLPADLELGFSGMSPAPIVTPIRGVGGEIVTDGIHSVNTTTAALSLAGEPPMAVAFEHGDGVVVFIADGSILYNPSLDDNAAWLVSLIPDGPVRFDELRHGFTARPAGESPTGLLVALPERVRTVVLLLVPVVLVALVTYGRRFGPAEQTERILAPPRRELVDAVAGLMTRMSDPVAVAGLVPDRLRTLVERKAGLPAGAPDHVVTAAGSELGLDAGELAEALNPRDENAMLAAQRMLADLSEREHL